MSEQHHAMQETQEVLRLDGLCKHYNRGQPTEVQVLHKLHLRLQRQEFAALVGSSGFRSVIPFWLALSAVLFSVIVALISGFYPALRAMRLSPLTAIRNE